MEVSARFLNVTAALIWYIGGIVLTLKGISLLEEASILQPGEFEPWLAITAAVALGFVKAKYIFIKSCKKNLARISKIAEPKIWQFFRPKFLFFLMLMIATGATLSRMAHGNYPFLISVGILDLSIATALLTSSYVYWQKKAFLAQN